jgi:F0F1-type ATP synthase assembly protein I
LPGPEEDLSGVAKAYRSAAPWLNAVSRLTGGMVVGVLGGFWFDRLRATGTHWGVLVGSVVGISMGFIGFITSIMKLNRKP